MIDERRFKDDVEYRKKVLEGIGRQVVIEVFKYAPYECFAHDLDTEEVEGRIWRALYFQVKDVDLGVGGVINDILMQRMNHFMRLPLSTDLYVRVEGNGIVVRVEAQIFPKVLIHIDYFGWIE